MLFPTLMILLRSGTGGRSLSNMARAGLASPALHTNALNDLLFLTWRNYQNVGLTVTSFSLIPLFSPALLNLYSASCHPSPACHGTSPAPGSLRLWMTLKHVSCDWHSTGILILPAQSLVLCQ